MPQTLEQQLTGYRELGNNFPKTPTIIKSNLNPIFELRPYQDEAFGRFVYYMASPKKQKPTQLLFHMATGSGKTLIMAGAILYLYEQGYRNFLFFVNSTNIINKTRENFLNPLSRKYLFSEVVSFGDKKIRVREVDTFQSTNGEDINIVFTTIQALHSRLNTPQENSLTYDDFTDQKIALISDEAHHINVDTRRNGKLTSEEKEEIISWEGTVNKIFSSNADNILLEFTATIDMKDEAISNKYFNKLIFDYSLKQFRIDGYSKEVKVLQADVLNLDRALQAVILSQYRRKVFEKNKKRIKPVILFKSKTIKESKEFHEQFLSKMKHLTATDIDKIQKIGEPTLKRCFEYFKINNVTIDNLVQELKNDFSEDKCIEVNSKEDSEEKQIVVNTLEDETNEYRAVFAVDKLNEGWDVLNLFDIVRLYDTRDAKQGKPGNTTISEAQLIGRGARYCPFQIEPNQPKYMRKYDKEIDNELRICEELYYHSAYNPKYIQELNTALQEIGIKSKETKEIRLQLKPEFKASAFYENGLIFINEPKKYDRSDIFSLPSSLIDRTYHINLQTGFAKVTTIFEDKNTPSKETKQKDYFLHDLDVAVIRKAINKLEFYQFNNLKSFLPHLNSVSEFIDTDKYLRRIKLEVEGTQEQVDNLKPDERLSIAIDVLEKLSLELQTDKVEYKGTTSFKASSVKKVFKDKTLNIALNENGEQEFGVAQSETTNTALRLDLGQCGWYAFNDNYGTSEEKYLVRYIDKMYEKLKDKYDSVYLLRNEKHFQIYTFDNGQAIEPDYVLFLNKKEPSETYYYQVFIEPKGSHLIKTDEWKELFLMSLKQSARIEQLWESRKYTVWGMPFYNEGEKTTRFEPNFDKILN